MASRCRFEFDQDGQYFKKMPAVFIYEKKTMKPSVHSIHPNVSHF